MTTLELFPWVPKGHFSCRLQYEFQRFVSSTGNMEVLLSHKHSIGCALACLFWAKQISLIKEIWCNFLVQTLQYIWIFFHFLYKRDIIQPTITIFLIFYIFFAPENMKRLPSKIAHYLPKIIFLVLPKTTWSAWIELLYIHLFQCFLYLIQIFDEF